MGPEPDLNDPTPGTHIWGWMTPDELTWLHNTAKTMRSVVEIGSLHGRSAFALLSGCPGPVYCIDPWDDEYDTCYGSFMGYCGGFDNLRPVRGYSPRPDVMSAIPEHVDMVFIDGNHDLNQVLADITAWLPRTRKLICGHDYAEDSETAGFPDVKTAVDMVFGDRVRPALGRYEDGDVNRLSIWAVDID